MTKEDIREIYRFLIGNCKDVPIETIDFIINSALEKLRNADTLKELKQRGKLSRDKLRDYAYINDGVNSKYVDVFDYAADQVEWIFKGDFE